MNTKVAAVVILYCPGIGALESLLEKTIKQVDTIYLVDNSPLPSSELLCLVQKFGLCDFHLVLGENRGIATAQNIGIARCRQEGFTHVLLLDQDSSPKPDMVFQMLAAEAERLAAGIRVAAIGPLCIEEKTGKISAAVTRCGWFYSKRIFPCITDQEAIQSDFLFASGSLIRMTALDVIGSMCDDLFIDCVDIEWGVRALKMGWLSYVAPLARMDQNLGDTACRFLGRNVLLHNDARNYYNMRNSVFLIFSQKMTLKWKAFTVPKLPYYLLIYVLKAPCRMRGLRMQVRAIWNGATHALGKFVDP